MRQEITPEAGWDEYLTIAEVAAVLKVSPKRVRNMMSAGDFIVGRDFLRRSGIGPRFLRSRIDAWLRGDGEPGEDAFIPMARSAERHHLRRAALR